MAYTMRSGCLEWLDIFIPGSYNLLADFIALKRNGLKQNKTKIQEEQAAQKRKGI